MKMATLHERSGSPMELKDFAKSVRQAVKKGNVPEYDITVAKIDGEEFLRFTWRRGLTAGNDTPHEPEPDEQGVR